MEAVWGLVTRGLAFIDYSQPASENWVLCLTETGRAAVEDREFNPEDPTGYLEVFAKAVPQCPDIVNRYVREAPETYTQRCYMACAVMVGVAAEGTFLDMAESFCRWLRGRDADNFRKILDNPRSSYNTLVEEFRKRVLPRIRELPPVLAENLDIEMNSTLMMIRRYRNESGHPTGVEIDRGACFLSLVAFAEAAKRLYALKTFFDSNPEKHEQ